MKRIRKAIDFETLDDLSKEMKEVYRD